jgi:N-methylhydantoinase B
MPPRSLARGRNDRRSRSNGDVDGHGSRHRRARRRRDGEGAAHRLGGARLDPRDFTLIAFGGGGPLHACAVALTYASEEMGIAVRNAAYSPNIKERLDHSCAIFDRRCGCRAGRAHPVHLGSLPWGLRRRSRASRTRRGDAPGDQWVVNDPYLSGTHLNDVTVIRPIFVDARTLRRTRATRRTTPTSADGAGLDAAQRARPLRRRLHHAADALDARRRGRADETVALFRANSRTPETRSGDLRAQLAGNVTGERRVRELVDRYGIATVAAAIERDPSTAKRACAPRCARFPTAIVTASDVMEDMRRRAVDRTCLRLEKRGDRITLDYTGTSPQSPMPLNAVYGVTLSGIYYAIRAVLAPISR